MIEVLKNRASFITAVLFVGIFVSPALAQLGPRDGAGLKPTDLERVRVGDLAPDFTLRDTDRREISLSDFQGRKNVILVFFRGHW